jgi:hypothetical protein
MILVRSDLAHAARQLDLGLRLGERSFILKALFGQDTRGMLEWLSGEAQSWITRHGLMREPLGVVASFWEERAASTLSLLEELKLDAGEVAES